MDGDSDRTRRWWPGTSNWCGQALLLVSLGSSPVLCCAEVARWRLDDGRGWGTSGCSGAAANRRQGR